MRRAFAGGERMLMMSAVKVGFRIPQHRRVIDTAVAESVSFERAVREFTLARKAEFKAAASNQRKDKS